MGKSCQNGPGEVDSEDLLVLLDDVLERAMDKWDKATGPAEEVQPDSRLISLEGEGDDALKAMIELVAAGRQDIIEKIRQDPLVNVERFGD